MHISMPSDAMAAPRLVGLWYQTQNKRANAVDASKGLNILMMSILKVYKFHLGYVSYSQTCYRPT